MTFEMDAIPTNEAELLTAPQAAQALGLSYRAFEFHVGAGHIAPDAYTVKRADWRRVAAGRQLFTPATLDVFRARKTKAGRPAKEKPARGGPGLREWKKQEKERRAAELKAAREARPTKAQQRAASRAARRSAAAAPSPRRAPTAS